MPQLAKGCGVGTRYAVQNLLRLPSAVAPVERADFLESMDLFTRLDGNMSREQRALMLAKQFSDRVGEDAGQLAVALDARMEALCGLWQHELLHAWLAALLEASWITVCSVATCAPVNLLADDKFAFDPDVFFPLLLAVAPATGRA